MKQVKIGIIGCGWIVQNAHIPALRKIENVVVTSVYDSDDDRAQQVCRQLEDARAFDDIDDFTESGIDAAIVATPNYLHVQYTLKMLEKGIGVLCEKPIAFEEEEINRIIQTAKEHNAVYFSGFVNRWREDILQLTELIRSNQIGNIKSVDAGWIRRNGVPRPGTWFTNKKLSGGGVLVDLGSHVLDICNLILDNKKAVNYELFTSKLDPDVLSSIGAAKWFNRNDSEKLEIDVEHIAIVNVEYEDGISLHCNLSWLSSIPNDCTYFKVTGDRGEIELKTLFGFSTECLWEKDTLTITENGIKKVHYYDKSKNNSRLAFKEMLSAFVKLVRKNSLNEKVCSEAFKMVSLTEHLYKVENADEIKANELLKKVIEKMR